METSMPGVFAVGDVRHGSVKRVASAVGAGAIAVQSVHEHFIKAKLGLDNLSSVPGSPERSGVKRNDIEAVRGGSRSSAPQHEERGTDQWPT
jgi:hypothetical protein